MKPTSKTLFPIESYKLIIFNYIFKVAPLVHTARVQLIDLTPEEAQKLITQQVIIFANLTFIMISSNKNNN